MLAINKAREDVKQHPKAVFGWIVIASFLYYHRYYSLFEDEQFDKMCSYALKHYDAVEHRLKYLVGKDDLQAGSLFALTIDKYPPRVVWLADSIAREQEQFTNSNKGEQL